MFRRERPWLFRRWRRGRSSGGGRIPGGGGGGGGGVWGGGAGRGWRAAPRSAFRTSSSKRATRSSVSHSPAVYDSPRPSLPRVARRRTNAASRTARRRGELEAARRTGAEAARGATRQLHLEGAAVEAVEGPLEQSSRRALERAA